MIWHLKDRGVRRPQDLPQHIERRLRFALSRFSGRIQKIVVFLDDQNGPRGGPDKVCRVLVKTRGLGVVLASATHADWFTAVDQAAGRIGHSVARHVARRRTQRGPSSGMPWLRISSILGAG
jgi:putative sigma-54 modulation protein